MHKDSANMAAAGSSAGLFNTINVAVAITSSALSILGYFGIEYAKEKQFQSYYNNVYDSVVIIQQTDEGEKKRDILEASRDVYRQIIAGFENGKPPTVVAGNIAARIDEIPVENFQTSARIVGIKPNQSILVCDGTVRVAYIGPVTGARNTEFQRFRVNGRVWTASLGEKHAVATLPASLLLLEISESRAVLDIGCGK